MKPIARRLLRAVLFLAVAYAVVLAVLFVLQTWLIFPTYMAAGQAASLPAAAVELEIATPDGERLRGLHLPAARKAAGVPEQAGERLVILGFGGNAWNAASLAGYLHALFPAAEVVAFHYRGYAPSSGSPGAAEILADAPLIYDHLRQRLGAARVVAVGFSLGASVAAELASERPLAGLILVTPFDSLEATARDHYPWVPVGWLLRHHMSTVEPLRAVTLPTAIITAGQDTIVPPARAVAVRQAIATPVLDRTIAGAGHNDLYAREDFRAALREALARIE
jgi:pimeloyl-ACP methyl ester carboxylesterase